MRKIAAVVLWAGILLPVLELSAETRRQEREISESKNDVRPDPTVFSSASEWNLSFGVGIAHVINNSAVDTNIIEQSVRWGRVFSPTRGDRWYQGAWQFGLGISPAFLVLQNETVYGTGITPSVRRLFNAHGKLVPTLSIGIGILITNEPVPKDEARFNFTPHLGFGLYYFFHRRRAITCEYRFHHISNAGRTERNPGINSSMIVVGISLFR